MKLYNTATRIVENFEHPIDRPVLFYSCGPTVYDEPHIGNWFTFIRYDLLARTLRSNGYSVDWVMNITDVGHLVSDADEGEDKLEKGAKREGLTAWKIADKYTSHFLTGLNQVNIEKLKRLPKATDHIKEQINLIKNLESKGHTYVIDSGVYFDTSTFPDYGKMAKLNLTDLQEGHRVAVNHQKRNKTDFALWKFTLKGQQRDMEWDSPWGKGFPGWHLECSAMSMHYLGPTLDIHGGGIDHIPIHHTNEIAQSEAATGKPYSRFWFHSNFILVDGKKMSKSAGNFITLNDIRAKGFDFTAFRLLVLQSQYRTEAHFSWENLQSAQNRLKHWQNVADRRWQIKKGKEIDAEKFLHILGDDLNTPGALSFLDDFFNDVENSHTHPGDSTLNVINNTLGINLFKENINIQTKSLLNQRQKARNENDWVLSDHLREELKKHKIEVKDTSDGQIWFRL